jgi:cytochrome c biogenesis protein CcmG, thiol:disulfide interchange protein DsbE
MTRITGVALLLAVPSIALADKDKYDVGEEVPVFTLKALNGEDSGEPYVSVDKYYGPEAKEQKKAIILSFFATYCEPCKKEMPYLAALYDTYKDKGLQILSISIDKENDKVDFAKNLAKEKNVKFPVLTDRFNIVAKRYFIAKLPCVYVINGEGRVTQVHIGYTGDVTKSLHDEVRKLVGEPEGGPVPPAIAQYLQHAAPADGHGDKGAAPAVTAAAGGEEGEAQTAAVDGKATKGKKAKGKGKGKKK